MWKQQSIIYTRQSMPGTRKIWSIEETPSPGIWKLTPAPIEQSILQSAITCGYCGRLLIASVAEYRCHQAESNNCRGVSIAIETLDAAVWNEVTRYLSEHAITLISSYEPISKEKREVLEMLGVAVVNEPISEEKRQVIEMLGVRVILYSENDTTHDYRYEIKLSPTTV